MQANTEMSPPHPRGLFAGASAHQIKRYGGQSNVLMDLVELLISRPGLELSKIYNYLKTTKNQFPLKTTKNQFPGRK